MYARLSMFVLLSPAAILFGTAEPGHADDWPQWGGPQRDAVWRESGIVDRCPHLQVRYP